MSKPSQAQVEANRANSKHGHGPNTPRGKERSSHNALRHGLTGRIVVLPTEDMGVYNAFSKELVGSLNPESPMECQFAQTVADTQWRLNRARRFEDGMIALGHYELQAERKAAQDMRLSAASVPVSPASQAISPVAATTSEEIGFVCSNSETGPLPAALPPRIPGLQRRAVLSGFVNAGSDYDPGAFDPAFFQYEIPVQVPLWFRELEAAAFPA